ncbi:MAG: lysozyme [Sphingomonas bacterium]|uniref:lysozyme n=1 Tax=Sphingomonas bacterium TaxID=1895847 RepID=UPI00260F943F|nr:lysozyme [Sphingomonas bacterium]MDB5707867.1 lysozyme [Sphingomonas bacterium]
MTPSKTCIDNVKRFEGCELTAYPDPGSGGDPWTIGFGATGPGIKRGVVWTQQQANDRLAADVARFGEQVAAMLDGAPTTQGQFDAMTSFAFNVGARNLATSTLLRMHRSRDYDGAVGQFLRWNKAAGKVMNGLTTRREAEAAIYRGG